MPVQAFALTFMLGAAVVALWLVHHYVRRAPGSLWSVAAHLVVANVAVSAAMALVLPAIAVVGPVAAMMLVAFPPLVYFFAAAAWLLLFLQRLVAHVR
jgi:hypothetical protein